MAMKTVPDAERANKMTADAMNPRFVQLEGRVDRLEEDVGEIKKGVQKLLDRPQNLGFTQVITTLLSTLGLVALIFGFAEWRLSTAIEPSKREIAELKKSIETLTEKIHAYDVKFATLEARYRRVKKEAP
jgi:regulator of replication initiation timing